MKHSIRGRVYQLLKQVGLSLVFDPSFEFNCS